LRATAMPSRYTVSSTYGLANGILEPNPVTKVHLTGTTNPNGIARAATASPIARPASTSERKRIPAHIRASPACLASERKDSASRGDRPASVYPAAVEMQAWAAG
jgi:hypothetical protein